jgi:hypothetical protein
MHGGVDDVWSALRSGARLNVDKDADIWQTFEERVPCLAETLQLSIEAEKLESLPGIIGHYVVRAFLGNDEHGRTSFASHTGSEWPPSYPHVNISGRNFMLKLIPWHTNAIGRRTLSTLMTLIPGTHDTDLTTQEFYLCGQLGGKGINGRLELRLSWFQDGVLHSVLVPFIPASLNTVQSRRDERWSARRSCMLLRARPESGHLVYHLPQDLFRAVAQFL